MFPSIQHALLLHPGSCDKQFHVRLSFSGKLRNYYEWKSCQTALKNSGGRESLYSAELKSFMLKKF
jgi:hypothetical protein